MDFYDDWGNCNTSLIRLVQTFMAIAVFLSGLVLATSWVTCEHRPILFIIGVVMEAINLGFVIAVAVVYWFGISPARRGLGYCTKFALKYANVPSVPQLQFEANDICEVSTSYAFGFLITACVVTFLSVVFAFTTRRFQGAIDVSKIQAKEAAADSDYDSISEDGSLNVEIVNVATAEGESP